MDSTINKPDLTHLPNKPGVYLHKNSKGEIIYVGKAINLKSRVNQYWQKSSHITSPKTAVLALESVRVDYLETPSEIDALFLESELIKRYQPKFNIELKDDKSATYVRIPYNDPIPAISFTRAPRGDGATYVGPFYAAGPVYSAMKILRRALPYSTHIKLPKKPCLHYQMGLCPGPETEAFDLKKYRSSLKKLEQVLKGDRESIIKEVEKKMFEAAKQEKFEIASRLRNQLRSLQRVGHIKLKDSDVFGSDQALAELQKLLGLKTLPKHIEGFDISHMSGSNVVASQVVFKNGVSSKTDYRNYKITNQQNNDFESMADVISRRFKDKNVEAWGIPDLILIDGGKGQLGSALLAVRSVPLPRERLGEGLNNKSPRIWKNQDLTRFAKELRANQTDPEQIMWSALRNNQLGVKFRRQHPLGRYILDFYSHQHKLVIELDGGQHNGNSELENDQQRAEYLKSQGIEVLRFWNDQILNELPDVLSYIYTKLNDPSPQTSPKGEAVQSVPMFGLAKQFEQVIIKKEDQNFKLNHKFAAKTNRIISDEGEYYVISFSSRDPIRLLLERVRNEAHRFAVRYHTKLKDGTMKATELTKIPGIGPETARKLLTTFGSVNGVKSAHHNQLASVVGNIKAKNIERYFS